MLQFANQLPLFSGVEEVQTFHDSSRGGYFSILADVNGKKKQSSYRLSEMPTVLNLIDTSRDTWISQAEFFQPNRRVVNLARVLVKPKWTLLIDNFHTQPGSYHH